MSVSARYDHTMLPLCVLRTSNTPADSIVDSAKAADVDLIVMGSKRSSINPVGPLRPVVPGRGWVAAARTIHFVLSSAWRSGTSATSSSTVCD